MINYTPASQLSFSNFEVPSFQSLDAENRWVKLADLVPWDQLASTLVLSPDAPKLKGAGRPTLDLRLVIAALLVQQFENLSDLRTLELIRENIYVQYFCGLAGFQSSSPFEASSLTHWRKWLGNNGAQELSEVLADELVQFSQTEEIIDLNQQSTTVDIDSKPNDDQSDEDEPPAHSDNIDSEQEDVEGPSAGPTATVDTSNKRFMLDGKQLAKHKGTLLLDATCAPANIRFPTDVALCSDARMWSEIIIDQLYKACIDRGCAPTTKPRTYRKAARKKFVSFCYKKRPGRKLARKSRRQQLQYLERNLRHIDGLMRRLITVNNSKFTRLVGKDNWPSGTLTSSTLTSKAYKRLIVCHELARQQRQMADAKGRTEQNAIADRIVSLEQPHIRPIVRGKAAAPVEFGPKFDLSLVNGIARVERLEFDAYHEGLTLIAACIRYAHRYGCLPEKVEVDSAYLTRENRKKLKSWGIIAKGKPLGRPPTKDQEAIKRYKDLCRNTGERNPVEGWFGVAKRRYGLDRLACKLASTTTVEIHLKVMVINLATALRQCYFYALAVIRYLITEMMKHHPSQASSIRQIINFRLS